MSTPAPPSTAHAALARPLPRLSRLALERARSSHDQIAAILGTELLSGVYPPGTKLPGEPALIARFGISRTVMREVVKTLAAKGFVTSKTRVGTQVRDPVHWNYFDADVLAWRVRLGLDDEFLRSLTEVRRALEPPAAALAASRRTEADLARLRACVREMARTDHSRHTFAEADLDFHLAIGSASGNPLIRSMASVIETALVASFAHSSPVDSPADHQASLAGHRAVVEAIASGDAQGAARALLEVIELGVSRIDHSRRRRAPRGR